jgi:hypothetical protein
MRKWADDQASFPMATEVELGSINSLRVTASDVSAVELDLSAAMQPVTPIIRKTKIEIVNLMIWERCSLSQRRVPLEQPLGL